MAATSIRGPCVCTPAADVTDVHFIDIIPAVIHQKPFQSAEAIKVRCYDTRPSS